jgi:hypothetical protein
MTVAQIPTVGYVQPGEIRLGFWCDTCEMLSVVELEVLLLTDTGVIRWGHCRICTECNEYRPGPNE